MFPDEEGFVNPRIDLERCTDCGLCRLTCPINSVAPLEDDSGDQAHRRYKHPKVFAAWNHDVSLRKMSSSGGVFTALAEVVLEKNGVVFGAAIGDDLVVRHIVVDNYYDLERLRGSKYVQSDLSAELLGLTKTFAEGGRQVFFSGTPCQVAGLRSLLGRNYSNLFTCDLVCHGVPSPMLLKKYLSHQSIGYADVASIDFRDKASGWREFCVGLQYKNGIKQRFPITEDLYMTAYLRDIALRPACYSCPFASAVRHGDVTLGDFWGVSKRYPAYDLDNRGTSLVMINTTSGLSLLEACRSKLFVGSADLVTAIAGNPVLSKPVDKPPQRAAFYRDLVGLPFTGVVNKYHLGKIPLQRKLLSRVKRAIRSFAEKPQFACSSKGVGSTRIGILTFHWATNYGAVLQAYALKGYLEARGHDVRVVDYIPLLTKGKQAAIKFLALLDSSTRQAVKNDYAKEAQIDRFREEHLRLSRRYYSLSALKARPPDFDVYIAGSDQIWNHSFTLRGEGKPTFSYFLAFGEDEVKRIAYAASFGSTEYPQDLLRMVTPHLLRFNSVSVRENSGKDIVESAGIGGIHVLPDPTLLLGKNEYDLLMHSQAPERRKGYVLIYALHSGQDSIENARRKLEERFPGRIVNMGSPTYSSIGVEKWLSLMDGADCVVTNSYHGMIFSILFKKQFLVFPVEGTSTGMNDRIQTILPPLGLQQRMVEIPCEEDIVVLLENGIDWKQVDKGIDRMREAARGWFEKLDL